MLHLQVISNKSLVDETVLVGIRPYFVEVVHIQLNGGRGTCLTKEEYLLCLKYLGRMVLENSFSLTTMNPTPVGVHFTILSFSGSWVGARVLQASSRFSLKRKEPLAHVF